MNKLYIIGNGFDLWHGLPTRYSDFYAFAQNALNESELYFEVGDGTTTPWHDFENFLGTYDWQAMFQDYDHTDMADESFRPSECYGLEDELDEKTKELVETVAEKFQDWISEIDVSDASKKIKFEPDSFFINFNYTSTLQKVYEIDAMNVLHIHGSVDDMSDLIFGHGATMEEEPELDEHGDSNRTMFTDAENAAKFPFHAFKKQVGKVIADKHDFFESLDGVSEVIVIGHSMNNIDLPYFQEIAKFATRARWRVCCYTKDDEKHHVEQLARCGVKRRNILQYTYKKISL